METPGGSRKSRILFIVAAALAVALLLWHCLSYRGAANRLADDLSTLADEVRTKVSVLQSRPELPAFAETVDRLGSVPARLESLRVRSSKLLDASTFLQRPFGTPPDSAGLDGAVAPLRALYPDLPALFLAQDEKLGQEFLSRIPSNPPEDDEYPELRQQAIEFKTGRATLRRTAEVATGLASKMNWPAIEIQAGLSQSTDSQELERWIDYAAETDTRSQAALDRVLATASTAAGATARLDPDAGAAQIAGVLSQWVAAEQQAREAYSTATGSPATDKFQTLVFELLYPRTSQLGEALAKIESSRNSVEQALGQARQEESTFTGALFRAGRRGFRAASSALSHLGTSAAEELTAVSARVDQGIAESMVAASKVVEQGIQVYQETRKPEWQRFLETPGGGGLLVAGGVLVLALVIAAVGLARR